MVGVTLEIERRFLVLRMPACEAGVSIRQGYLSMTTEADVRLRCLDGEHTLCAKRGAGLARLEAEITLTAADFDRLWLLTEGAQIEKRRHALPPLPGSTTSCIDRYTLPARFDLLEVEFDTQEAAESFVAPDWCGEDVTALATPARFRELLAFMAGRRG